MTVVEEQNIDWRKWSVCRGRQSEHSQGKGSQWIMVAIVSLGGGAALLTSHYARHAVLGRRWRRSAGCIDWQCCTSQQWYHLLVSWNQATLTRLASTIHTLVAKEGNSSQDRLIYTHLVHWQCINATVRQKGQAVNNGAIRWRRKEQIWQTRCQQFASLLITGVLFSKWTGEQLGQCRVHSVSTHLLIVSYELVMQMHIWTVA